MGTNSIILYQEEFTASSELTLNHNLDRLNMSVRIIVNNEEHAEYIQQVRPGDDDPRNTTLVYLIGSYTGRVQLLQDNTVVQQDLPLENSLGSSGDLDWDAMNGSVANVTLTGTTRINNPSNLKIGETLRLVVNGNGLGYHILNFGTVHLDLTSTNCTITAGTGTATLKFNTSQDLSELEVGDKVEIANATNNRNNQKGFPITAINDTTDTITFETPNGSTTETSSMDVAIISGKFVWRNNAAPWHCSHPTHYTLFEFYYDGTKLFSERKGIFSRKTFSSSAKDEIEFWEDFSGTSLEGAMFDWGASNANDGAIAATSTGVDGNHPGAVRCRLATTDSSRFNLRTEDNTGVLSGLRVEYEVMLNFADIPDSDDDCYFQIGFGDDQGAGEHAYGVYFKYDWFDSANWVCVTANAGTRTEYDTGIPIEVNKWYRLGFGPSDGGPYVTFRINGLVVAQIGTNLPLTERLGIMHKGERYGTGTQNVDMNMDYAYMHYMIADDRDDV